MSKVSDEQKATLQPFLKDLRDICQAHGIVFKNKPEIAFAKYKESQRLAIEVYEDRQGTSLSIVTVHIPEVIDL